MPDVASLRLRLPELEASIRTVVAKDPTLSPAVADALIAAIRDGSRVTERQMRRDEAILWMAYQPEPGRIDAIAPACLRLERNYEAFEITVEVPEAAALAQTPTCAIAATRGCEGDDRVFTVDVRGSSPGAQVTMTRGGQPATVVGGPGATWTVADPGPYDLDATFTVRAEGGTAAARKARVFRFLMPKVCGNLAYLGEAAPRALPPGGHARLVREERARRPLRSGGRRADVGLRRAGRTRGRHGRHGRRPLRRGLDPAAVPVRLLPDRRRPAARYLRAVDRPRHTRGSKSTRATARASRSSGAWARSSVSRAR